MMHNIYSFLYIVALLFIFPFEYFKRPGELRTKWLKEKLGFLPSSLIHNPAKCIWVHAVSVGEVMAARPLLKRLAAEYPSKKIILSTITDTGRRVAVERASENTTVVYMPFDIPFLLNAILKKINPGLLVIIETELWPNFIRAFRRSGIPVLLLNGRISEKSFRGYKKIAFFMKKVLSDIEFFGMQNEEYADRIRQLGAEGSKVLSLGNFKFESVAPAGVPEWAMNFQGQVIIAGSTNEGEEELITDIYLALKKEFPDLNLVIAPRHPERFNIVAALLSEKGEVFHKRSALSNQMKMPPLKGVIVLLDTVGELTSVYGSADMAVIGKSFRGYGGQNPLEPALWGKAVVCGPHMENFPVVRDFCEQGAAFQVQENELRDKLRELLLNPEKAGLAGMKARELCVKNAGAVTGAMKFIKKYLQV